MPNPWPVTIRDDDNEFVEVDTLPITGRVYIGTSYGGVRLNAAQFEEFSKVVIAASWAAKGTVPP